MPYLTHMIDDGKGVVRVGRGIVRGQEIIRAMETWTDDVPMFRTITHGLVDFTEATSVEITADEIRRIAELEKLNSQGMSRVFLAIAASQDIAFGMSRMYRAMTVPTGWIVNVVRTRAEAVAWLRSMVPTELS